jgi:HEPN domain-containing protein
MKFVHNLTLMAYDDYITSRFLINNGHVLQGAILASTAIEKYFKAMLVALGTPIDKIKVHMDRFDKLKSHLDHSDYYQLFTNHFDEHFFEELRKAYLFRYYDNIKQPTTLGFFVNQFLGELDWTVYTIETLLIMHDGKGNPIDTRYKREVKEQQPQIFENNFVLNKIKKKDFMVRESNGFGLYYNPTTMESYTINTKEKMRPPYLGKLFLIAVDEYRKNGELISS